MVFFPSSCYRAPKIFVKFFLSNTGNKSIPLLDFIFIQDSMKPLEFPKRLKCLLLP